MKNIAYIFFLFISLTSCGVKKEKMLEHKRIESLISSLNYKVTLPENWKPILNSHNLLSYSPKNLGDIFYKNIVQIHELKAAKVDEDSLNELVQEKVKQWNNNVKINSQNLIKGTTKYGETYTYVYEHNWNSTHYKNTLIYFRHNDTVYEFNYSSDIRFYEKYKNDVAFILNNLKFNE